MSEVVVVTGASAGVGRAVAREFGRHGASVALVARSRAGLEGAAREIEAAGGEALVLPADVANPDQVEAAAQSTVEAFGPRQPGALLVVVLGEFTREQQPLHGGVSFGSLFGQIARLMNDAAGVAQGVRREFDTVFRNQAERILRDLDVVQREEFEAVKEMARLAREENEALKLRIAALEARSGTAETAGPMPSQTPGIV